MVIVQIDRVYEDVYKCSALIDVIHRHFADKIEKGINLSFGQTDLLVILNGELRLQFRFLGLASIKSLGQHIHRLSLFNAFPKVLNRGIDFLDGFLDFLYRKVVRTLVTFLRNPLGNIAYLIVGEHLQTHFYYAVFDIFFADNLLITFVFARVFAFIIMVLSARLARAAVAYHHFLTMTAEKLGCQ